MFVIISDNNRVSDNSSNIKVVGLKSYGFMTRWQYVQARYEWAQKALGIRVWWYGCRKPLQVGGVSHRQSGWCCLCMCKSSLNLESAGSSIDTRDQYRRSLYGASIEGAGVYLKLSIPRSKYIWSFNSVGQKPRLITGKSWVRVPEAPFQGNIPVVVEELDVHG